MRELRLGGGKIIEERERRVLGLFWSNGLSLSAIDRQPRTQFLHDLTRLAILLPFSILQDLVDSLQERFVDHHIAMSSPLFAT